MEKESTTFVFKERDDEPQKITVTPVSYNEVSVEFEESGTIVNHEGNLDSIFGKIHIVGKILEDEGFDVYSLAEVDEEREAFKEELLELLEDDEMMAIGADDEIIYEIDDIKVYGGFEYGSRGVDHNILLSKDVDWEDIINWGTVVVPETMTYISDEPIEHYEEIGYENLPTDNNHIMGYSSSSIIDNDFDMEL